MTVEWVLLIWVLNKYPMSDNPAKSAVTELSIRFNDKEECTATALNWVDNHKDRDYACVMIQRNNQLKS